jgi:hypothetical protein
VMFADLVGSTELAARFDRACGAARSRGHGAGDPNVSWHLHRGGRAVGRAPAFSRRAITSPIPGSRRKQAVDSGASVEIPRSQRA